MHNATIINNTILYTWNLLRVDLKCPYHGKCEMMDMLISLIGAIISQWVCISKYLVVYLKYIQFPFVDYTLIKMKKEMRIKM